MHRVRHHKLLFLELVFKMYWFKVVSFFHSFEYILKKHPNKGNHQDDAYITIIKDLHYSAAKFCFWKNQCFTSVLAVRSILNRKQIENKIYLGLDPKNQTLKAHAWIKSDNQLITSDLKDYSSIFEF